MSELHSFSRNRKFPKYYLAYCECIVQCICEDQFPEVMYLLCVLVFSALSKKREARSRMLLPECPALPSILSSGASHTWMQSMM